MNELLLTFWIRSFFGNAKCLSQNALPLKAVYLFYLDVVCVAQLWKKKKEEVTAGRNRIYFRNFGLACELLLKCKIISHKHIQLMCIANWRSKLKVVVFCMRNFSTIVNTIFRLLMIINICRESVYYANQSLCCGVCKDFGQQRAFKRKRKSEWPISPQSYHASHWVCSARQQQRLN